MMQYTSVYCANCTVLTGILFRDNMPYVEFEGKYLVSVQARVGEHAYLAQNERPVLASLVLCGQAIVKLLPYILDPPGHLRHLFFPFTKHGRVSNYIGDDLSTVNRWV